TDSPLQATLWIQMLPVSAGGAKIRCTLKAELNMMLKMMIGKKLEKGIDNFADMLAQLPYQMM
ncbi:MAG: SRPBCC family protein, partial [Bacteroidales bacterium]|nr:SRPBCC family protein [Bacteroidales bacterium]